MIDDEKGEEGVMVEMEEEGIRVGEDTDGDGDIEQTWLFVNMKNHPKLWKAIKIGTVIAIAIIGVYLTVRGA